MTTQHPIRTELAGADNTQLASIFTEQEQAKHTISEVIRQTSVAPEQITVISPNDPNFNRKLEGESKELGKMMWYSHLILGGAGLLIGMIVAYVLVEFGPALTQNNPLFTYIAMVSPGIFIGLFVAGLLSLRPDRTEIIDVVREAVRNKRYAVIVNLRKGQPVDTIRELFSRHSDRVIAAIQ